MIILIIMIILILFSCQMLRFDISNSCCLQRICFSVLSHISLTWRIKLLLVEKQFSGSNVYIYLLVFYFSKSF